MKTKYDIIVVGGGLTGRSAAACVAARRGADVLLVEALRLLRRRFGTKPCLPFYALFHNN